MPLLAPGGTAASTVGVLLPPPAPDAAAAPLATAASCCHPLAINAAVSRVPACFVSYAVRIAWARSKPRISLLMSKPGGRPPPLPRTGVGRVAADAPRPLDGSSGGSGVGRASGRPPLTPTGIAGDAPAAAPLNGGGGALGVKPAHGGAMAMTGWPGKATGECVRSMIIRECVRSMITGARRAGACARASAALELKRRTAPAAPPASCPTGSHARRSTAHCRSWLLSQVCSCNVKRQKGRGFEEREYSSARDVRLLLAAAAHGRWRRQPLLIGVRASNTVCITCTPHLGRPISADGDKSM